MNEQRKEQQSPDKKPQNEEAQPGKKAFMGATSTDSYKPRLQTVESNHLDDDDSEQQRGTPLKKEQPRSNQEKKQEDISSTGSVKTAAFDEGNEPRDPESLKNRGKTLGSDDRPK